MAKSSNPRMSARPIGPHLTKAISDRFWTHVDKTGHNGCWLWTAFINNEGYGAYRAGPMVFKAHRVAYTLLNGEVPDLLPLDHLCRVRACVNPAHLEPVTNQENIIRGFAPTAVNARKTHCPKGHPLAEGNLEPSQAALGRRSCHTCHREASRQSQLRLRAAAKARRLDVVAEKRRAL